MSTSYDIVDNSFLNKISDDYLLNLTPEEVQSLIDKYRTSAIPRFKQCKKLSDRDDTLRKFNDDLSDEEIEILANIMVLEWLKPSIYNAEKLKNSLSTKDYKLYSPANLLKELQELKKTTEKDISILIVSYTFSNSSLDDLL